jgi:hypothetical protein
VDEILNFYETTRAIRVDRARLAEAMEAWVPVAFAEDPNASFSGFGVTRGILTWMNSGRSWMGWCDRA